MKIDIETKVKYYIKNIGVLSLCNFSSKILVFLLVPLYTSYLSTEDYGVYDLVVSTIQLAFPILTINIVDAVMRFGFDNEFEKSDILQIGTKYVAVSALIGSIVVLFLSLVNCWNNLSGLYIYVVLYYISFSAYQLLTQFAKGIEKVKEIGIAGVISTAIMLVANIIFLVFIKSGLIGFFISNILAQIVPVLYLVVSLRIWKYKTKKKYNKKLESQMVRYSAPLLFTTIGWWVNNAADKYVITFFFGTEANGILSVAYKIPSIINTVQGIFIQAWQISAIKEYNENQKSNFFGKVFETVNLFMGLVCFSLILLTKPLAKLLYANDFYEAWKYVPFLLVCSVINCASGYLGPILAAKKDSKNMARASIYGALANIVFNIILVQFIDIQGATIATIISSMIIYVLRLLRVKNEMKTVKQWRVWAVWIGLIIQSICVIYTNIWYWHILIFVVMILVNFNLIVDLINGVKRKKEPKQ